MTSGTCDIQGPRHVFNDRASTFYSFLWVQYQTAQTFFFADTELLRLGCPVESSLPLRNHRMTFERLQYVRPHCELLALDRNRYCLLLMGCLRIIA